MQGCASGHRLHGVAWSSSARCCRCSATATVSVAQIMSKYGDSNYFDTIDLKQNWCFTGPFRTSFRASVPRNTSIITFFEELKKHFSYGLVLVWTI